jgi:hypothetical protein
MNGTVARTTDITSIVRNGPLLHGEQKLTNPFRGRLRIPDTGVLIDSDQLSFPFEGTSVDEHPLDVLRLRVAHGSALPAEGVSRSKLPVQLPRRGGTSCDVV